MEDFDHRRADFGEASGWAGGQSDGDGAGGAGSEGEVEVQVCGVQPLRVDVALGVADSCVDGVCPLELGGVLYRERDGVEGVWTRGAEIDGACGDGG